MILEITLGTGILVIFMALVSEYADSTLGMGYGTALAPLLLLMGFSPFQVVPCVLLSELFTGLAAAAAHHRAGNVSFDFRKDPENQIAKRLGRLGYLGYVPKSSSSKIALILGACSVIGVFIAVFIAISIPAFYLKLYIGLLVLIMGIIILTKRNKKMRFSWKKLTGIGALASFNKGMSGGGYGPLVTSGQILSGVNTKNAIGITSLAESMTCLVGVLAFLILGASVDWSLAPFLIIGAMVSVPLSALTVKKVNLKRITVLVGIATMFLGMFTLVKLFM